MDHTLSLLRKSPNCGIASKIRIAATPTNVYDRTYIFLYVYNSTKNRIGCSKLEL
jgi:hypothetical protein